MCAGTEALFEDATINAPMLLGRCHEIKLTNQGFAQAAAQRVREIAQSQGLDGRDLADYVKLAQLCKNSMRKMLQRV